jgi:hypothetical protein
MTRPWIPAVAACAGTFALGLGFTPPAAAVSGAGADRPNQFFEEQLQAARDAGQSTVVLLVAAKAGQNPTAVAMIEALGGTIAYREDSIDYLRVLMPLDAVDAVAALPAVQYVDLNQLVPLPDPRPDGVNAVAPQPAPGAGTPRDNPYMPIGETGAAQFMAANPSWDGRGVRIGIIDSGVTLDHPSLQTTSTGARKIVDWVTYTDPFTDGDPTWVNMAAQVQGASFAYEGAGYTAPYAGSFRIGLFNERHPNLGGEVGNDVNRDGNPAGSSGVFAVLWDTATNRVWVDANQNRSFADEAPMTDYRVNYDVGYFGTDNPATPLAERMPFVVQTDGRNKFVNIGIVSGAHGSHVAGITSANAMFGGQMSGAAPGAQLVSVRVCLFVAGCTSYALIEGMIYAAKQANVDVINMSIGGLPALNDGNNTRAALYNRLIERYNVQMFFSAGNSGPGINTVGDPSVATRVVSVASSISNDTYTANYGTPMPFVDNMHYFSSRGPREDGGFKPQISAPGAAISTTPMWQPGGPVPGTYALPPGYQMFNGTSMASPQAAGAAALLISAAKQAGKQYQPAQLRQAMLSSARFMDGSRIKATAQGNGIVNVGAAWNLLKTNIKTAEIWASVPVDTILKDFFAVPGVGTGIYDREGVRAGSAPYTRTYKVLRTKGSSKAVTYNLSWTGNDGSFTAPAQISLPLNVEQQLTITIDPATAGEKSAILNFDDPTSAGVEFQTLNTVLVHDAFTGPSYAATKSGTLGAGQSTSYFFAVPTGTPAFKVDMIGGGPAGAGAIRFLRWHPYGVGVDNNAVSNCYNGAPGGCSSAGSATSRIVSSPQAGVWEVSVDARRNSDNLTAAPFSLTASILGVQVAPNPDVVAVAQVGVPVARSYTLTNLYGAFTGRAVGGTLGSALTSRPTIAAAQQQTYDVVVTPGSSSLRATIGNPSDAGADLDLFVLNCTSGTCVQAGSSADGDSEESVTIANPAPGLWRVLVDGYAVPAGTTAYDYVDVFVNNAFGSITVTDANALRPAGGSWVAPGTVAANAVPAAGRVLLGTVVVRTDTNTAIGSGTVIVQSVTP